MSNSYKKTPRHGNTNASSEKDDKRYYNSVMRSHNKMIIQKISKEDIDSDEAFFYTEEEIMDIWTMAKDGKHWWGDKSFNRWANYDLDVKKYVNEKMRK